MLRRALVFFREWRFSFLDWFAWLRRSPSALVMAACVGFLVAIAAHSLNEQRWLPEKSAAWVFGVLPILIVLIPRTWRFLALAAAALVIGILRYDAALTPLPHVDWPEEPTFITGTLDGPPDWRQKGSRFVLREASWEEGRRLAIAPMGLLVTAATQPSFLPGDVVLVLCKPKSLDPESKPAVAGRVFLHHIGAECRSTAEPELVSAGQPSVSRTLGALKLAMRRRVGRLFVEPRASFMLGLLSGDDAGLPYEVTQQFRATGTSHIIAVSGYNVNKIAGALLIALAAILIPRRWASLAAIAIIAAFVVFTGASASVVRAGVMSGFALLARALGRPSSQPRALVYAATLMLAMNPLAFAYDLGFGLSFAAVAGLILFSALTARLFRHLPERMGLRASAAETTAATIGTAPLSLHSFGALPLFAVPVNVVVLPAVPIAMGLGFLALIADAAWHPLSVPFVFAADLAMRWMLAITAFGQAHLYHSWRTSLGVAGMVAAYLVLMLIARLASTKTERD
jgi:competence protein ComEC